MLHCNFVFVPFHFFKMILTKHTSDFFPSCQSNNQLLCGILINDFTIRVADYEQKITYDWFNQTKINTPPTPNPKN